MDKDDEGLSAKILTAKEFTKRAATRVAFHFKAFGLGVLFTVLYSVFPSPGVDMLASVAISAAGVGALTYLSLLLLFPAQTNRNATILGSVAGLASLLTGAWMLAAVCAGLAAWFVNLGNRWKFNSSVFVLTLVLAGLGQEGFALLKALPAWYYVLFTAVVGLGVLKPAWAPGCMQKLRLWWKKRKEKKHAIEQHQKEQQAASLPLGKEEARQLKEAQYQQAIVEINQAINVMTESMRASAQTIVSKTQAIIQCMRDDEHDIAAGDKFLSRYLPMITASVSGYKRLAQHQVTSPDFLTVQEQTTQALISMATAFSEMHQHLLDNDVDDLLVDLKVLNQIIKIDGYQVPQDKQPR